MPVDGRVRVCRPGAAMVKHFMLAAVLLMPLVLASCGDDEPAPAPASWAPLHYDYLTKLRLNVGSIDVQDHSAPQGDNDVAAQSPTPPAAALAQMARDRLFAAGLTGHADFVIDQASIIRGDGGVLNGLLAVHLDLYDASGARVGYAEARVARQHIPGSDPENLRNVLYDMTRQMMDAMNVELEYQLKRSLRAYLVTGDVVPAAVTATPLGPSTPGAAPPAAPPVPGVDLSPGAPAPDQGNALPSPTPMPAPTPAPPQMAAPQPMPAPPQDMPPGQDAPPPEQMSPPPGYLQLPPGAVPQEYQ